MLIVLFLLTKMHGIQYEIEYNKFIRTTDDYHIKACKNWLERCIDKGDIYKSVYTGWYCTPYETFVTEKDAQDRTAGKAHNAQHVAETTHIVSEETYFFKLSAYQDKLLAFYKDNPDFILLKNVLHEVISFVESGLKDLSISRTTVTWGVPFPNDPSMTIYVWVEALSNYITAIGMVDGNKTKEFNYLVACRCAGTR